MKKQIRLLPDQHELVVECLKFVQARLNKGFASSDAHLMAGRFVLRRIDEVLEVMGAVTPNGKTGI